MFSNESRNQTRDAPIQTCTAGIHSLMSAFGEIFLLWSPDFRSHPWSSSHVQRKSQIIRKQAIAEGFFGGKLLLVGSANKQSWFRGRSHFLLPSWSSPSLRMTFLKYWGASRVRTRNTDVTYSEILNKLWDLFSPSLKTCCGRQSNGLPKTSSS